jgi:hypothetical protein
MICVVTGFCGHSFGKGRYHYLSIVTNYEDQSLPSATLLLSNPASTLLPGLQYNFKVSGIAFQFFSRRLREIVLKLGEP